MIPHGERASGGENARGAVDVFEIALPAGTAMNYVSQKRQQCESQQSDTFEPHAPYP
jgi:hypothetical protein